MSGVSLALDDAVELTELLQFIDHWLANDHDQLNASLHRFVGNPSYDISRLRAPPRPVQLPPRRRHRRRPIPTPDERAFRDGDVVVREYGQEHGARPYASVNQAHRARNDPGRVILMFQEPGPSWRMSINDPIDLHLALFVRDACGLTVSASPSPLRPAPSLAHPVPADERAGLAAAWQAWWQALLSAHRATNGRPPEGLTPKQQLVWQSQPRIEVVGTPPDFVGLAHAPILQAAVVRCWQEGFRQWWEQPPTAELRKNRPETRIGGARGDLTAAIMTSSRAHLVQHVVSEVEGSIGRKAAPFELALEVLAVEGTMATQLTPNHALVPIGLYTDSIRYRQWLRQTIMPLA